MKSVRILSLLLAAVLHVLPLARVVMPAQLTGSPAWAIILKFGAGLAATLGSYNAVSGATFLSPASGTTYNLTVGVPTNLFIAYSGVHIPASYGSTPSPACPGMFINSVPGTFTTISGVPTTAGSYSSVVRAWENSNLSGNSVSATYNFIVAAGPAPPVITNIAVSPASPVAPGVNVTFTPAVGGTGPLFYRWYQNGAAIFGATNATLTVTNVQATNGGIYSLRVSDTTFGVTTNATNLVINTAPVVLVQPEDRFVALGASATFSNLAGGQQPLAYQWRRNGTNIANATNAIYTIALAQNSSAAAYSVLVSNTLGVTTSSNAWLRISNTSSTLTVPLISMSAPWRYQSNGTYLGTAWREWDYVDSTWPSGNGILAREDSGNANVFPYIGTPLSTSVGAKFITNFYFRAHFNITNRARLTSVLLSNVIDDGAITYFNGVEITRVRMPGGPVNANTFALVSAPEGSFVSTNIPASFAVQGDNVVAVEVHQNTNTSSDVVMGAALFAVYNVPNTVPFMLTNPVAQTAAVNATVNFTAMADASPPVTYRWYRSGVLLSGTNTTLSLPLVDAVDDGNYTFVAQNSAGSVTSAPARLTITGASPPAILVQPADIIVPTGSNGTLAVSASGSGKVYQWRFNSNIIAGATAASYTIANAQVSNRGFYSVTVSNIAGGFRSREAWALVVPPPASSNAPTVGAGAGASQMTLSFPTQPGYRYIVQSSPTLETPSWTTVTNVAPSFSNGVVTRLLNYNSSTQSFLRVLVDR
jgi:hypothetical protein